MTIYSRKIKARKARHGWDLGRLDIDIVPELAAFMNMLNTEFGKSEYRFETTGMHGNELRLYTDDDLCAARIDNYLGLPTCGIASSAA